MKRKALVFVSAALGAWQLPAGDVLSWVDPFIGTGGNGHTTPAAAYPFGMVQPGPDTGHSGWARCSGYQYGDRSIERFSQTHLSGTGCSDFTDVGFMPFSGDIAAAHKRGYKTRFDKDDEEASPGYYAVTLDGGVKVEATCTEHVALYRITYLETPARLLYDPSWAHGRVAEADITPMKAGRVSGHVGDRRGWPDRDYYFAWELSAEPVAEEVVEYVDDDRVPKTVYSFDLKNGEVLYLKVSLSRSSAEGARRNIDEEVPGWDFDGVLEANREKWRSILSRVKADGSSDQLKGLYTSIYHLCFQPNRLSDVGEKPLYSTFSCWDTYRAAGPLYTILTPEYVPLFIDSMMWHFDKNGFLPVWALWGKDNQCMIGVHSVPMIVDACLKGFGGVDWETAFRCVETTLTKNRRRHDARYDLIAKYGYYPCDVIKDESVSRLLEDCYDDACAARFAKALGRQDGANYFFNRSRNWTNCFDSATGFIRGRDSKGAWREPFDPYKISHIKHCDYTEGNAFHWNWHVMQDPDLLVGLLGGKDAAVKRLEGLFNEDSSKSADKLPDVTGLIGQYCHGNEPSHHDIYFFSLLGRRDLAAKYIREVVDTQYGVAPDGLCGNDDCGQMSAWYVFAAMGFYPFDPCGGEYVLGEAQMKEIAIDVGGGKTFRVVSDFPGAASGAVELDGRKLDGVKINHADILKGGTLHFTGGARAEDFKVELNSVAVASAYEAINGKTEILPPRSRIVVPPGCLAEFHLKYSFPANVKSRLYLSPNFEDGVLREDPFGTSASDFYAGEGKTTKIVILGAGGNEPYEKDLLLKSVRIFGELEAVKGAPRNNSFFICDIPVDVLFANNADSNGEGAKVLPPKSAPAPDPKLGVVPFDKSARPKTSTPRGFTDNLEKALAKAKKEGKLVYACFSGSDWCGWCRLLEGEVFARPEFVSAVKDDYVLVFIDTPKDKSLIGKRARKENPKLVEKYGIEGFPTALILDGDGKKLAETGYRRGGAKAYADYLLEIKKAR